MKSKVLGLLGLGAAVALTACGGGSKDAVQQSTGAATDSALKGTTLNLYTWDGMFPQEVLDGFTEKTGVKVNYSNFDLDETMLAKLEETKGGDYDIVVADDYIIQLAIGEGLVKELDKSKISTYDNINPLFQSKFYDPDNKYTMPYGAGIPLIVYNPETVKVDIQGYNDLWNPELAGNVGIIGNYRVIDGITLKSLGYSFNTNDLTQIQEAGDKLKTLAPNIRLINDNNLQDYLLSGEVGAAFMYTSQVNQALKANPDLKVVYPKEGLGFGIMAGFIPSKAPNAEAAYKFLEYINEPEVAAKCFEYIGYFVTNKAAESYVSDDWKDLIVFPEDKISLIEGGELIENISDEANELHNKLWEEFRQETN